MGPPSATYIVQCLGGVICSGVPGAPISQAVAVPPCRHSAVLANALVADVAVSPQRGVPLTPRALTRTAPFRRLTLARQRSTAWLVEPTSSAPKGTVQRNRNRELAATRKCMDNRIRRLARVCQEIS